MCMRASVCTHFLLGGQFNRFYKRQGASIPVIGNFSTLCNCLLSSLSGHSSYVRVHMYACMCIICACGCFTFSLLPCLCVYSEA